METVKALEILNARRYVRVTEKLREASAKMAKKVADKMQELQIGVLNVGADSLLMKEMPSCTTLAWTECTTLAWADTGGNLLKKHTADEYSSGSYFARDFNAWIAYPTADDVLRFGLRIGEIIAALQEAENQRTADAEQALANLDGVQE